MTGPSRSPRRVFLSHTAELRRHPVPLSFAAAAEQAIAAAGDVVADRGDDTVPARVCRELVDEADVHVLVAGHRYGALVPDAQPSVSYPELEFDTATAAGMHRLVFLVDQDAVGPASMFLDHEHGARQVAFRTKAGIGTVIATVTTPEDLRAGVYHALTRLPRARTAGTPAGRIWTIPARLPVFTGRDGVLDRLAAALGEGDPAVVHAVTGVGGIGKTATAIEYAHRRQERFDVAWWVPAEDPALVRDRLAALAHALNLTDPATSTAEAVDRVHAHLQRTGRWLLVFDNAESPADLAPLIPSGPGQVLITSRHPHWRGVAAPVGVEEFTRGESTALLSRRAPQLDGRDADRVAEAVGDVPLSVDQAGTLLAAGVEVEAYLKVLDEHSRAGSDQHSRAGVDHATGSGSAAATWAVAFDDLAGRHPAAFDLLTLVAWLAPEPVPLPLLFADTARPDGLPEHLRTLAAHPLVLLEAIDALTRRGLVRADPAGVVLHRVPAAILRTRTTAPAPGRPNWAALAVRVLRAVLPADVWNNPAVWPTWQQMLPHVQAATAPDRDLAPVSGEVEWLLDHVATYRHTRGEPRDALPLFRRAHDLARYRLGTDHPDTLNLASNLAHTLHDLGELDQAQHLHTATLDHYRRTLGRDHPHTLNAANNLAFTLHDLGEHQHARELHADTLGRYRQTLGNDHPHTLNAANNLAIDLHALGEHRLARRLHADTLARRRRTLGEDHPDTLSSAGNLALDLSALGQHELAHRLHADTFARYRRILGGDHPLTLNAAGNLAAVLGAVGDHDRARDLDEDTLARRRRTLGPDHPDTLTSANNLAADLHALGEHESARDLGADTLRRSRRVLGDSHPDTRTSAENLAAVLDALGESEEAERWRGWTSAPRNG